VTKHHPTGHRTTYAKAKKDMQTYSYCTYGVAAHSPSC